MTRRTTLPTAMTPTSTTSTSTTSTPRTASTHDPAVPDTDVMVAVHTFFRRELRLAGPAVRRVTAGDVRRARTVADHLSTVAEHLHRHHSAEDELMWPLLLARVPEELAPLVHLMESQHATVDALLGEVGELVPRWRESAGAVERDRLAGLLERLYVHLAEHLEAEEERLLPVAAREMNVAEWERVGEEARGRGGRRGSLLVLGMIVHDADPAVVARMLAGAPRPVRWLLPRVAHRVYRRRALQVHGTSTP